MADVGRVGRERAWRDAAAGCDAAAWCSLFEAAYDRVEAYIRWRLGGAAEIADDAIQETWLIAAKKVASFDPAAAPFVEWVRGIAGNVLRNQLRSRRRTAARVRPLAAGESPAVVAVSVEDESAQIARALAALPEHYERVLRAKYVDGWPVLKIAEEWDETPKAVESLLSRARAAFREAYERDESP